jgi:hypothetical protein
VFPTACGSPDRGEQDPVKRARLATPEMVAAALGCSTLQISTDYAPLTDLSKRSF